ncbi:type IV toxin-antitoxin system AbiEi family antitoxin [Microbacterium sp. 179-B 1A2 NHS]|uniref:type IV toxin-antitoxin system AbiEi family antitoxin n=1 Tax=Microbacterium sp. 179-B 1A2 NHS TaxID=3142383 RepID=UPI0039A13FB9
MWPFLYVPGDRLSTAELTAACLDGDLVEIGDAYMPADAVETREMRAASLRTLVRPDRALTHASAAWVHGAIADPPSVHTLQRASPRRNGVPVGSRVRFRDVALPTADVMVVAGVRVTTPVRTLVDVARAQVAGGTRDPVLDALIAWRDGLLDEAIAWLERSGPVHHKRAARDELRRRQDVVTR